VGSTSSTHGVPGLENCFQLKSIGDAQAIRRRILDNFEAASLPTTSPEERKRLLSFVICGGGPTGIETAAVCSSFAWRDNLLIFGEGNIRLLSGGHCEICAFGWFYHLCKGDLNLV